MLNREEIREILHTIPNSFYVCDDCNAWYTTDYRLNEICYHYKCPNCDTIMLDAAETDREITYLSVNQINIVLLPHIGPTNIERRVGAQLKCRETKSIATIVERNTDGNFSTEVVPFEDEILELKKPFIVKFIENNQEIVVSTWEDYLDFVCYREYIGH